MRSDLSASSLTPRSPVLLIILGACLVTLALFLHGPLRGFGMGAGGAIVLVAVALWSVQRSASRTPAWLPSRDGDTPGERPDRDD